MKKLIWIIPLAVFLILPYELFVYNEGFLTAMNMLRGLAAMAIVYCAIIWLYFRMRKTIDKKYVPEILVVSAALAISVVGKALAIVMDIDETSGNVSLNMPEDGWQAVAAIYYSLYQAIGGLSFEGLADYEYYENWRTIIYAGTSVLAGLVAVSIITFSFSYEIYSTVSWMTTTKHNRKIYVFTAVTEDSVMLAHSIADHHAGLKKEGKKQKYAIIFLRTDDQEGFNGKDPLHLDIMHSGFLFRSYAPGKKNKSIPEFLKIKIKNDYILQKNVPEKFEDALKADAAPELHKKFKDALKADKAPELHIFALDWEKGKTSENDKLVCEDVARVTERLFGSKLTLRQKIKLRMVGGQQDVGVLTPEFVCRMNGLRMIINYHYLLSEDIDISNVDMRFANEVSKFAKDGEYYSDARPETLEKIGSLAKEYMRKGKKFGDEKADAKEKAFVKYKQHFVFDAINEANMAAFSYVRKRAKLVEENQELYNNDVTGDEYRVLVIGFGQNGQQTMKMSYIYAAAGKHEEQENSGVTSDTTKKEKYYDPDNWKEQLQESGLADYTPQPFIADVYDKNATEVGGLFKKKHPSIRVNMPQSTNSSSIYTYVPIMVNLHHESAYSINILDTLDDNMGKNEKKNKTGIENQEESAGERNENKTDIGKEENIQDESTDKENKTGIGKNIQEESLDKGNENRTDNKKYNLIIIALGDDDSTVNIANAILEDSKHEELAGKGKKHKELSPDKGVKDRWQVIAINLRNRLNYDRINWNAKDEEKFTQIKVIRFGSSEEMYSYDNIVDMSLAKQRNYGYEMIQRKELEGEMKKDVIEKPDDDDTKIEKWLNNTEDNAVVAAESEWAKKDYYDRTSSRYACEMPAFIKAYSVAKGFAEVAEGSAKKYDFGKITAGNLVKLGAVEHDRWVRWIVSFGFKRGGTDRYFKEHSSIKEYREIDTQCNDMINVLNAFKDGQ